MSSINTKNDKTDDIALIAQHISEHAEAIYQSWKARGLSPTDILKCHNNDEALSRFNKVLRVDSSTSVPTTNSLSNERLEKLVDQFVEDDKARYEKKLAKKAANSATTNGHIKPTTNGSTIFTFKKNSIIYKNTPTPEHKSIQQNDTDNNTWPLKNGVHDLNKVEKKLESLTLIASNKKNLEAPRKLQSKLNGFSQAPTRPFLTRGSVAERVLIFEKCPNSKASVVTNGEPKKHKIKTFQHTTLQRHVKNNRKVAIPRFYYPAGKPIPASKLQLIKNRITATFKDLKHVNKDNFYKVVKACDFPLYWKLPLYFALTGLDTNTTLTLDTFLKYWQNVVNHCFDDATQFVYILTRGIRQHLLPEDFVLLIQDVIDTHPGLVFLKEATEFHSRYTYTVIARIFYTLNRSWTGRISLTELRKSSLLHTIALLEQEGDINQVTAFFSYEHFYVIYCKFWELDRDHDLFIDRYDLMRHGDHALSSRIIDRIFSGAVTRGRVYGSKENTDKMSYIEFVWFLLAEEDKAQPTAIEYWFRCMDIDGDGYLSIYELEYFYEEQVQRMEVIGIETLPFEDCICQMLDIVQPQIPGRISLSDLKKCKLTSLFFDTFFNLQKYLDYEQRDPFATVRLQDADGHELTDWDRFAAEEYELLVAEESVNKE